MIKAKERKLVVALEIGTTKVTALIGEIVSDDMINILGIGNCSSQGMEKGDVTDLDSVVKCIKHVIHQAENMANCHISSIYLALSGKNIQCRNEIGMVTIADEEVTQQDVKNVINIAQSVRLCDEHRILHVIPQEYSIDYQEGIKNPIGLCGIRMKVSVHLITCHSDMEKNIIKAIERCHLRVDQLIFSGLASSLSVLTADERELGVCLIDIGGGTMDIVIYTNGVLRHSKVIPYAGNVVTNDIAYAFSISPIDAEAIKLQYGSIILEECMHDEYFEIPSIGSRIPRNLPRQTLVRVIEARYNELLHLVHNEVRHIQEQLQQQSAVKHHLASGIVLTGGAAQIDGLTICAQRVFDMPVRIGQPLNITGLTDYIQEPNYSTVIGLLHHGKTLYMSSKNEKQKRISVNKWFKKINHWLKKEF